MFETLSIRILRPSDPKLSDPPTSFATMTTTAVCQRMAEIVAALPKAGGELNAPVRTYPERYHRPAYQELVTDAFRLPASCRLVAQPDG